MWDHATVLELDRGSIFRSVFRLQLFSFLSSAPLFCILKFLRDVPRYPCNYGKYLEMKAARLAAEDAETERARTKLRRESEWMSRQPK